MMYLIFAFLACIEGFAAFNHFSCNKGSAESFIIFTSILMLISIFVYINRNRIKPE